MQLFSKHAITSSSRCGLCCLLERVPEPFGEGQAAVCIPPVHENNGRQGGGRPGDTPLVRLAHTLRSKVYSKYDIWGMLILPATDCRVLLISKLD